jgi:polar amino acid transport system substrate-binding protein
MRALLICCLYALANICVAEKVTLSSTDYPPYCGPGLPQDGVVTAIVVEAFRRAGDTVEIRYRPRTGSLEEVKVGATDGMVGAWYSREWEAFLAYSQPVFDNRIGFYARKDRWFDVQALDELREKGAKVGVVRGSLSPARFAAAHLATDPANDDEQNLQKLARGRIDMVLIDRDLADYLLTTRLPKQRDDLLWLEPEVGILQQYVGFSRRSPGWERRLARFNAGLEAIRKDGTLEQLKRQFAYR